MPWEVFPQRPAFDLRPSRRALLPDERPEIASQLRAWAGTVDVIVTTGGTGLSPRDITPEATRDVIDREVPGMAEAMRAAGARVVMVDRDEAGLAALQERHGFLEEQLEYVRTTRRELNRVIKAVDEEIQTVFAAGQRQRPPQHQSGTATDQAHDCRFGHRRPPDAGQRMVECNTQITGCIKQGSVKIEADSGEADCSHRARRAGAFWNRQAFDGMACI